MMSDNNVKGINVPSFENALIQAMGYPYPAPDYSYTLRLGKVYPFAAEDTRGRKPLLSIASNISPQQLLYKFGGDSVIPLQRAWLADHDVVFAAHLSDYASVPGMLIPARGTQVFLGVAWLNDAQLARMDATELHAYSRTQMNSISLRTLEGEDIDAIEFYRNNFLPYAPDGAPIALDDIRAENRRLLGNSVIEVLIRLYRSLSQKETKFSFLAFMTLLIENDEFRAEITDLMRQKS